MKISNFDITTARIQCTMIGRKHSRCRRFVVEIGSRHNTAGLEIGPVDVSINIFEVTNDFKDWSDTDLFDKMPWSTLRSKGVSLRDGRAMVDCYIYEWDGQACEAGDLVCNAQLEFDADGLCAVHADMDKNVWQRSNVI